MLMYFFRNFNVARIFEEISHNSNLRVFLHISTIKLKKCILQRCDRSPKVCRFASIEFRHLLFREGYIKGNLRGGNWVQILREVEFIRERRGEEDGEGGQWARGIAIGGHSSIRGINTLELMKAPREQQASGRNVNRDRPASDPFSCTANSQGP